MNPLQHLKRRYVELLHIQKSPDSIAAGFAVGTFWCILPTPGVSIALSFGTLFIFPRLSKIAMLISFAVFNPLVTFPFYPFSAKLGDFLLRHEIPAEVQVASLPGFLNATLRFTTGSLVLALSVSLACYVLLRFAIKAFKARLHRKRGAAQDDHAGECIPQELPSP